MKNNGFSLLEVLIAFMLITSITFTIIRQQWYLQKFVLQLITAHEQFVLKESEFEEQLSV